MCRGSGVGVGVGPAGEAFPPGGWGREAWEDGGRETGKIKLCCEVTGERLGPSVAIGCMYDEQDGVRRIRTAR